MNTSEERKRKRVQNTEDLETFYREFKECFPTLEVCMAALWKLFGLCEIPCTRCGKQLRVESERSISCPACRKTNWVTARTALHKVVRPDVWLAIILLEGSGIPFSSNKLATLLDAAKPTVRDARCKIGFAATQWMEEENPDVVSSAKMVEVYDRHSMETPYQQHPRAEQQEMERREFEKESAYAEVHGTTSEHSETRSPTQPNKTSSNNNDDNNSGDPSPPPAGGAIDPIQEVLKLLADGPLHFDVIAAKTGMDVGTLSSLLTILELDGEVQGKAGGVYQLNSRSTGQAQNILSPDIQQFIQDFIEFIKTYLHGISRKYVQLYLANYWYHRCRRSFEPIRLTKAWMARGHISSAELRGYVTPLDTILGTLRLNALSKVEISMKHQARGAKTTRHHDRSYRDPLCPPTPPPGLANFFSSGKYPPFDIDCGASPSHLSTA